LKKKSFKKKNLNNFEKKILNHILNFCINSKIVLNRCVPITTVVNNTNATARIGDVDEFRVEDVTDVVENFNEFFDVMKNSTI